MLRKCQVRPFRLVSARVDPNETFMANAAFIIGRPWNGCLVGIVLNFLYEFCAFLWDVYKRRPAQGQKNSCFLSMDIFFVVLGIMLSLMFEMWNSLNSNVCIILFSLSLHIKSSVLVASMAYDLSGRIKPSLGGLVHLWIVGWLPLIYVPHCTLLSSLIELFHVLSTWTK